MARTGAFGKIADPIGSYEAQNEGIKGVPQYTEKEYRHNQSGSHGDHSGRGPESDCCKIPAHERPRNRGR